MSSDSNERRRMMSCCGRDVCLIIHHDDIRLTIGPTADAGRGEHGALSLLMNLLHVRRAP